MCVSQMNFELWTWEVDRVQIQTTKTSNLIGWYVLQSVLFSCEIPTRRAKLSNMHNWLFWVESHDSGILIRFGATGLWIHPCFVDFQCALGIYVSNSWIVLAWEWNHWIGRRSIDSLWHPYCAWSYRCLYMDYFSWIRFVSFPDPTRENWEGVWLCVQSSNKSR